MLKTRLSLDDFISEMMRVPPTGLCLEQLQNWIANLDLKDDLYRHHIAFGARTYSRKLVCRTPRFDLLILCWQPGQCSTIHDHADSLSVTRVYRGVLTSREFAKPLTRSFCSMSATRLIQTQAAQLERGDLVTVDRHQIHQLANTSDENLVTLHVYARPLRTIQVYCPQSGQAEQVPVQCPVEDEGA